MRVSTHCYCYLWLFSDASSPAAGAAGPLTNRRCGWWDGSLCFVAVGTEVQIRHDIKGRVSMLMVAAYSRFNNAASVQQSLPFAFLPDDSSTVLMTASRLIVGPSIITCQYPELALLFFLFLGGGVGGGEVGGRGGGGGCAQGTRTCLLSLQPLTLLCTQTSFKLTLKE